MSYDDVIGQYFLELWRLKAKVAAAKKSDNGESELDKDKLEETEKLPTELNTLNSSGGYAIVGTDKLSVHYPNVNHHYHDVGVVQANHPAPSNCLLYYFEMFVKNAGDKGFVCIGFTTSDFPMFRQPGWEPNSYGYHGDDGMVYRGHGSGDAFGPTYTTGDTVGGGINYADQQFFFTKNGKLVGTVPKNDKCQLFPTVALHSQNEEVTVNFGKDPFLFDVKDFEARLRLEKQSKFEETFIPLSTTLGTVRSYLAHYGYKETRESLDLACKSNLPSPSMVQENNLNDKIYALDQRSILRQLIRSGEIDDAFNKLRIWYPEIVQNEESTICFLLHCQKFIELVRIGKLEEAVAYGRLQFEKFYQSEQYGDLVKDCTALLAYEQPQGYSIAYLLEESQREFVGDAVNAMILSTDPNVKDAKTCLHSCLERLIKQICACILEKRSLNGGQGEAFNLRRLL